VTDLDSLPIDHADTVLSPGDHERLAHVVVPASAVLEAAISGTPVTALCGKTWVPDRDPRKFAPCQTCQDRLAAMVLEAYGHQPRS
jgi:hypothetical protein